jgi:acyl transferase domain-containing protein/NADPH:quinone reductase-like Zn-dependent oxidoreductase
VELRNQLQSAAGEGATLPSTLVFDHPTARGLASFFTAVVSAPMAVRYEQTRVVAGDIRLRCIQARLPGGGWQLASAWRLVATGHDAFIASPASRWDIDASSSPTYGAFLQAIELFHNAAFGISTPEASTMDPQQRLLLELGYGSLHEAGLTRGSLLGSDTAIFVGVTSVEFRQALPHTNAYAMTGTGHCFAAGRLSYVLGLHGVCEAIDVACSAALVACHNAHRALQMGDSRDALSAGINMMFLPETLNEYATAGLTSPSGKAFVFDARANGFVRGEGCAVGVLQVAHTDVSALLVGSAVRQDGRSASLTAPNGRAQQLLLGAVLADASTTPAQLKLVEAAANGSALGDPVEAGAIAAALLVRRAQSDGALDAGSVKANVGHTESASGMTGMTKLLCAIGRAHAAPNAQLSVLSGHVATAWKSVPSVCALPSQLTASPTGLADGTVSSVGLGGTIASAVIRIGAAVGQHGAGHPHWLAFRQRSFSWQRPVRVHVACRGTISGMVLCEQPAFTTALGPNEVEVQVRAVGLNFKDVLNVLGELPLRFLTPPGDDCAGIVTSVGELVPGLRRGNELFGAAPGCLPYFVRARTDALLVAVRPQNVVASHACTLPAVWTTAHEILKRACTQRRACCLLHAATGGVGLTSLLYLSWLGGVAVATAGNASKHVILHDLGVNTCCSSRNSASFSYGLAKHIIGDRLHVVCNSLSQDFISTTMALLGEQGSFQEIGKRGAWSILRMTSAASMASPRVIDLATDIPNNLQWNNRLLRILSARLRCKVMHGLPSTEFSISRVHDAFQLLKSGGNVGKVVITSSFASVVHVDLRPATGHPVGCVDAKLVVTRATLNAQTVLSLIEEIAGQTVSVDAPLMEAGIDSLGAVELRNQLQNAVGADVPSTLMFDHPTARELAAHLREDVSSETFCSASFTTRPLPSAASEVAIVGSSVSLPAGVASTTDALHVVACGHDAVGEVPVTRWEMAFMSTTPELVRDRSRHGGFMSGVEGFANAVFAISLAEAESMDPQQRLILESGYEALHASCKNRAMLSGSLTGVFLGIAAIEFAQMLASSPAGSSVYAATGAALSIAAGRSSYILGLHGPCASYDAACAAALVACHGGLRALQLHEAATGLALGVNLMLAPFIGATFAVAGMTSGLGCSHTFDHRADGYARGESCGAVLLSRMTAEHEKVGMTGSAVRQDGRSASLTAPNGNAQQRLLVAALGDAPVTSDNLSLNEAHGTGTALGDPIEAGSLASAVLAVRASGALPLCVGGSKANLGHSEPAAGMNGLLILALGLVVTEALPNAQLRALNPHVDGCQLRARSLLSVQASALPRHEMSTCGGVSSFGFSGTIAHAVLCHAGSNSAPSASVVPLAYRRHNFRWRDLPHPFVQRAMPSSEGVVLFRCSAAGALRALVADHVVQGRVIFPGAAFLEMARAAGATALHDVYFLQPLAVEAPGLVVDCEVSDGAVRVRSCEDGALADAILHSSGTTATDVSISKCVEHAPLRTLSRAADVRALYDGFNAVGLQYGPGYRTLINAWGGAIDALARLRARSTHEGTCVHPSDLDDALCTSAAIASSGDASGDGETRLPFAVDDALLQGTLGKLWAVRSRNDQALSNAQCLINLALCSPVCRPWRGKDLKLFRCGSALCRGNRKRKLMASSFAS